mmetsp:Transcript_11132/g.22251  ORF Transcript_11132/g.22251 Transcript_11132/m.22251 type:complete len:96 (+) Transcript_11132:310-597(+)
MWCSVMESKDDVASSRMRMGGFFNIALAKATRCFSPPLKRRPRSPTRVSNPAGNLFMMVSYKHAPFAAAMTSSSDASGYPYLMLYHIVSLKSTVS